MLSFLLLFIQEDYAEDVKIDIEKYAHAGLSNSEIILTAIGVVLLVIAIILFKKNRYKPGEITSKTYKPTTKLNEALGCLFIVLALLLAIAIFICFTPLALLVYSLAMKAIKYLFLLAAIIGAIYLAYHSAKKYLEK